MRYIKLNKENKVQEIIPEIPEFTIEQRFPEKIVKQLIAIEDDSIEISFGMRYDRTTNTFYPYTPSVRPLTTEQKVKKLEKENIELINKNKLLTEQLEALSGQTDFLEECIVEMAETIYA